jgi:hypothetical protein
MVRSNLFLSTKAQRIRGFRPSATLQRRVPGRGAAVDDVRALPQTRPMGKGIWLALAGALLLTVAVPATAGATVRHASPTGTDTTSTCTDAEMPCSLRRAVETVAAPGDEVVVAPGTYALSAPVNVGQKVDVHGAAGAPRPRIVSTAPVVFSFSQSANAARLADLRLEAPGSVVNTTRLSNATDTATLERLELLAAPAAAGIAAALAGGWTLRDSVAHTQATNGVAVKAFHGTVHLANVTAVATDPGGTGLLAESDVGGICVPPFEVEAHALNVIARGGRYDLAMEFLCSGAQSLNVSFSNFRRSKISANPASARIEDGGGNQDAEPLFTAPASLDFHELAGSPTIDAGAATPALGATDLDGGARVQGSAPDIGAYETAVPPPTPAPDTRRPVASLLTVSPGRFRAAVPGAKRRRGARISYALDEAAKVTFTVKRILKRVVRHRKRTRYVPVRGSFADAGEVGGNRIRFSGRMNRRRLKPGLYRLVALPVDPAGNTGNAVLTRFRIVR